MTLNTVPKSRGLWRSVAAILCTLVILFLLSRYLMFWLGVPGLEGLMGHFSGDDPLATSALLSSLGMFAAGVLVLLALLRWACKPF